MATFLYGNAAQQFATGAWDWPDLQVTGLLVNAVYVPVIDSDTYVSDIPVGALIARSNALGAYMTSQAATDGLCSGILPEFEALIATVPVTALVLYVDTGDDTTSQLVFYSSDGSGFPFTPQGFNYSVVYAQNQGGWFQV